MSAFIPGVPAKHLDASLRQPFVEADLLVVEQWNSHHISSLDMGPLTSDLKETSIPLARSYQDSHGKKRCVGNKKELRESQPLAGAIFWAQLHLNDWFLLLGKLTTHEKIWIL